jgi:hypothetical protein
MIEAPTAIGHLMIGDPLQRRDHRRLARVVPAEPVQEFRLERRFPTSEWIRDGHVCSRRPVAPDWRRFGGSGNGPKRHSDRC